MAGHGFHITLAPLWQEWAEPIWQLVARLHRQLPLAEPKVTLGVRELSPVEEGVGAQYQLALSGDFVNRRYRAAYFVIQVQLVRQASSRADNTARIIWRIDSVPALERGGGAVDLLTKRRDEIPVTEFERLRQLFEQQLTVAAAGFFARIRAGLPPA